MSPCHPASLQCLQRRFDPGQLPLSENHSNKQRNNHHHQSGCRHRIVHPFPRYRYHKQAVFGITGRSRHYQPCCRRRSFHLDRDCHYHRLLSGRMGSSHHLQCCYHHRIIRMIGFRFHRRRRGLRKPEPFSCQYTSGCHLTQCYMYHRNHRLLWYYHLRTFHPHQ